MDKHQIDFVAHDEAPYADASGQSGNDVYAFVKSQGRFVSTQRTEGISTSDIINRIVKDYDAYIRRNLSRGYTRQQLNISFFKEQGIKAAAGVKTLQNRVQENVKMMTGKVEEQVDQLKTNLEDNVEDIQNNIRLWLDNSRSFVDGFANLFTRTLQPTNQRSSSQ